SVMVVEDSDEGYVVAKSDVVIVITQGDRCLVRGTIVEGDKIIADGVHRVAVGQPVTPLEIQNESQEASK
ncbi:MAG: hypothetical protein AAF623_20640, partial [Planctomycetota bacterium]